jgi:hypothetical protein
MPQKITLDPTSQPYETADQAATALADNFKSKKTPGLETAGFVLKDVDGKFRYSTYVGGTDDHFEFAAQLPRGYSLAAIVHAHPGKDAAGQVFSPDDLEMADKLKIPSYVRFLNDGSTRSYTPGKTAMQNMPSGRFVRKVARGDDLALPADKPIAPQVRQALTQDLQQETPTP